MTTGAVDHHHLPYRIAVLCYLYDPDGRLLLIHRAQQPNLGMYSPIGGKLEVSIGESPHDCAAREIHEESGVTVDHDDLHLVGMVSETAYEGETHWLLFLFEVTRPVAHDEIASMEISEGALEWVPVDDVATYPIPDTDRDVMWPLVRRHRGGFFAAHVDCRDEGMKWVLQESHSPP